RHSVHSFPTRRSSDLLALASPVRAIISTWFDSDILPYNVQACRDQGIEEIIVLDNASPDETPDVARALGLEVVSYETEHYLDEVDRKSTRLNSSHVKI